ncbi:hypothetical protein VDQ16_21680 [Xanthomonas campestris pv. campestris]|uniref:hypothetical protein n=2 Tax=Xanthomonas TaxID=338 RepID=UPI000AF090E8|nr:hypothetical protein [Xanthomonas campestris]MCC5045590.1 hypothetical protein [Xanthomonas campestris]MEA0763509.1 hypothetical protein [Xanthomonas campestris pv. campestris]MEB1225232.1 hypothetical protein [Xanthomonas campestris pv. campestris]MEB1245922.1 hypothetical protein [Xanthomonas campestris pv. campestris]MEB1254218.1 hypothetical protein [Xanthomonas campestris pv. campestris]
MKFFMPGDKKSALCHRDGRVMTTFGYRDVPFRDGNGVVQNVLVGTCDVCGDAILIPAQSTPAIAAARKKVEHSLEVNIPATFVDALDAAIVRVTAHPSPDFRKQLLVYYVNRYAAGEEDSGELKRLINGTSVLLKSKTVPKRRLSMKFNGVIDGRIEKIREDTLLSKTDLVKSIAIKIYDDIVQPDEPKHHKALSEIADVLYA